MIEFNLPPEVRSRRGQAAASEITRRLDAADNRDMMIWEVAIDVAAGANFFPFDTAAQLARRHYPEGDAAYQARFDRGVEVARVVMVELGQLSTVSAPN
jgi:hypothetical protein